MERYRVLLNIYENFTYEDPKCPSGWKGSGCYDITEIKVHAIEMDVVCDMDNLIKVVTEYANTQFEKIKKIYFLETKLLCVCEDAGPEEVLDCKPIRNHDLYRTR